MAIRKKKLFEGLREGATSALEVLSSYLQNRSIFRLFVDLIFIILVTFTISGAWIISSNFSDIFLKKEDPTEMKEFRNSIIQSKEIQLILEKVLSSTESNRSYFFKFHNGIKGIGGMPFFYMTNMAEIVSPGISREILNSQRLPISLLPNIEKFAKNECVINLKNDSSTMIVQPLGRLGIIGYGICPIYDINKNLIGFIGVDYILKNTSLSNKKIEEILTDYGKIISGTLINR